MAIKPERKKIEHAVESTIGGASYNINIDMGPVSIAHDVQLTNDDASNDISIKLNAATAGVTVKPGETQTFNDGNWTSIRLTNSSGSTVEFRLAIAGE